MLVRLVLKAKGSVATLSRECPKANAGLSSGLLCLKKYTAPQYGVLIIAKQLSDVILRDQLPREKEGF